MAGLGMLTGLLLMHLWPFSRPAVLIPLAWWTMYCVNRWKVSNPVLGLIDAAAEDAGFYPVGAPVHLIATSVSESAAPLILDDEVEDAAPSLA